MKKNQEDYYSIDESLFGHNNNKQIFILGGVNNRNKDFRLEAVISRNADTLKKFITTYLPTATNVMTEGWAGYQFLISLGSCYIHYTHNCGERRDILGLGIQSHM